MKKRRNSTKKLASRCPVREGRLHLHTARKLGALSFSSAITHGSRWKVAMERMREVADVRLEGLRRDHVISLGKLLAVDVNDDLKSAGYAQNVISTINTVMHSLRPGQWKSVSATEECGIPERILVRTSIPDGMDGSLVQLAIQMLCDAGEKRFSAVVGLIDALGLRLREASMLDARAALGEAVRTGFVTIRRGAKGRQKRVVPASPAAIAALSAAAVEQADGKSLIAEGETYKSFLENEIQPGRAILKTSGIKCPRELRAAWAIRRYRELTGFCPPLVSGSIAPDRDLDVAARLQISRELGHHRPAVTNAYLGGKKP